jgi:competence protein ComEC
MIPMQLLSFSAFSWLSPFINLIAVPLFSLLIIPLILLGCLFSLFAPPLALFCLFCADQMITLFFAVFAGSEGAYHIYSAAYCLFITIVICLGVVLYILYFQTRANRITSFVFACLVLIFLGAAFWERDNKQLDTWFVEALDVGQGLAVLVRNGDQTLLYDTGPRYPSGFNTATTEIVPYLHALGVTNLDHLVISHSDIDHAGGFAVIMDDFMPKNVLLGEPIFYKNKGAVNYQLCKTGQKWDLGALSVSVLSPDKHSKKNNNNSCVLRISDGQTSLLLTGDIEKRQEAILIKEQRERLASDLLFAPHHGSKHSSSEPFIKAVAPQWVVFSAGFMNHWKFPAEEVKLRYKNQSVNMVNSGLSGFIRFKIKKGLIKVQTYREDLAAYWYHHSFSL